MKFDIVINKKTLKDIQKTIEYYDNESDGLGTKFENVLDEHFDTLRINSHFKIRYKDVRCLPIKKFPYMIHFSTNEIDKTIKIHAVLHTSRNPKIWRNK
ncbi:MAG: type II toxin-antitoxin system RelE/ParE family toxin [Bacteroidales bacterium]|nr:type II toxin-antitoxin system RelE/ParE family toxin [Bacteroidales bacterium]